LKVEVENFKVHFFPFFVDDGLVQNVRDVMKENSSVELRATFVDFDSKI